MATEQEPEIDPETQKRFDELNKKASDKYVTDYEGLVTTDEFTYNGDAYKLKYPIPPVQYLQLKKLFKDKVSEEDEEKYVENFRKRACILIDGMTPEKFDQSDFVTLMKIVTAWSTRAMNFR